MAPNYLSAQPNPARPMYSMAWICAADIPLPSGVQSLSTAGDVPGSVMAVFYSKNFILGGNNPQVPVGAYISVPHSNSVRTEREICSLTISLHIDYLNGTQFFTYSGMNKILLTKTIQILLLVVLTLLILYVGRGFLVPIALAGLLSMLFLPLGTWLEKKGLNRGLSTLVCVLTLITVIGVVITLLSWQMSQVTKDLSDIKTIATDRLEQLRQYATQSLGMSREEQDQLMKENQTSGAGGAAKVGAAILGGFLGGLITFILAVVYIFMFLYYRGHFKKFILRVVPATEKAEAMRVTTEATQIAQKYLGGLGLMIMILWVLYSIGFSIVGVKNPVFFAILCGVLEIVPYVGNLTGTGLTLLMVVAQGGGFSIMIGVLITYGLIQFFQNNVLTPLIVGSEVNINPVFTIMALLGGEAIWGIPGMILGIPLLGIFKILCDHIEQLKPIGYLLGSPDSKSHKSTLSHKIKGWFTKDGEKAQKKGGL